MNKDEENGVKPLARIILLIAVFGVVNWLMYNQVWSNVIPNGFMFAMLLWVCVQGIAWCIYYFVAKAQGLDPFSPSKFCGDQIHYYADGIFKRFFYRQLRSTYGIDSLVTLDADQAEYLIEYWGHTGLELNGLKTLSDAAAESLSKHQGKLELNGLTTLSDAAAESLSKHQGELLVLNGLKTLSDAAAESLSKHQGELVLDIWLQDKMRKKIGRGK